MGKDRRASLSEAAELVSDGTKIGFGGSVGLYRRPVGFAHELIRQGRRNLDTFGILNGIEVDTLIGGGCVGSTNTSYIGFDELGQAPNFQAAASDGRIVVNEWTEWMITASYRAANMAIPYIPWITSRRNDVTKALGLVEVECPYTGRMVLAVRANNLDVAVIQAERADAEGNTEIPTPLDHMWDADCLVARAAKTIIVCVEEIGEVNPDQVQLIGREVAAVVEVPRGAAPGGLLPAYGIDHAHINETYVPAAREGRFDEYLERFVFGQDAIA
jgi:glutaconate CoA-transferase subunit A